MLTLDDWLEDIRIEGRVSASAATVRAWIGERYMDKDWYGNRAHKVMVF